MTVDCQNEEKVQFKRGILMTTLLLAAALLMREESCCLAKSPTVDIVWRRINRT